MKRIVTFLIGLIAGCFVGYLIKDKSPGVVADTSKETYIDTVRYYMPEPKSELALETKRYKLPASSFLYGSAGGKPRQHNNNGDSCVAQQDSAKATKIVKGTENDFRCNEDSIIADLPMMQRHYSDSTYEVWVSGPVDPQLDSVRVFAPTTIITRQKWKPPKRWHIGPTIGYGITPQGAQPFFGISITYSILSF